MHTLSLSCSAWFLYDANCGGHRVILSATLDPLFGLEHLSNAAESNIALDVALHVAQTLVSTQRCSPTPAVFQRCTLCFRGNVLELLDDIQELKPHMFCSVPRLWNRIYDRVTATIQASNPISRKLFETAYASKKAALDRGDLSGGRMGAFWDKLVFSKIRARIGGEAPKSNVTNTFGAGANTSCLSAHMLQDIHSLESYLGRSYVTHTHTEIYRLLDGMRSIPLVDQQLQYKQRRVT